MNWEARLIVGGSGWLAIFGLLFSTGPDYALSFLAVSAVVALLVALPKPKLTDQPVALPTEPAKSPEEIQEEVLRLVTRKVAFLESVEREHGAEARERVEELVQQHQMLHAEGRLS